MSPEYGIITERVKDGFTIIEIDTRKAKYQGIPWLTLGDYGKRKLENFLIMSRSRERLKLIYI